MSTNSEQSCRKAPVYEGIKQYLRAQIDRGELPLGARVPSEHKLARQFKVSRNQTRQALRELELEGYVIRRQGSGSFVAPRSGELAAISPTGTGAAVMIFPQYLSRYCREVVEGFMRHMAEAEHHTITYNWQKDREAELRLLRTISDSGVAGLVAWVEHDDEEMRAMVRDLRARRFPIVLVDRYLDGVDVDCVLSDNVEIGYRLTKALLERGHRRIAFAGWFGNAPSSLRNRLEGYQRALSEAGIEYDQRLVGGSQKELEKDAASVVHAYMAVADRPTAFVCVHDLIASLLHRPLTDLGYRVPGDVAFSAVADGRLPEGAEIPMIAVQQQAHRIGARSAAVLIERARNPEGSPQRHLIEPTNLIDGG